MIGGSKHMNRKQIIIITMVGIVTFCLGIVLGKCLPAEKAEQIPEQVTSLEQEDEQKEILQQSEPEEINILVRINNEDVEWYDGIRWNRVDSVEELMKNDKYKLAEANRRELEESLQMKRVETVREESAFMSRENNELYVGKKEVPKAPSVQKPAQEPTKEEQLPTETPVPSSPQTSTSEPDESVTPPQPPAVEQPTDTPPSIPVETPPSAPIETPPSTPVETPSDSESQTGDGENMEWSDDYL